METQEEVALRAQIKDAFIAIPTPKAEEMFLEVYDGSDDTHEMKTAFLGKHWEELPIADLFRHREMIIALSGIGFRAYLPAYLSASLSEDERYGADIRQYLLFGLQPISTSEVHVKTTRERMSLLDKKQRAVIASTLRYLEYRWKMKNAGELLRTWESTGRSAIL